MRKWLGIGGVGILAAILSLPYWLPLRQFIPKIEREASTALGLPVTISGLRIHVLPQPSLSFHGIRVGADAAAEVPELVVVPQLASLWTATKVIQRIDVYRATLQPLLLGSVFGRRQVDDSGAVQVRQVSLDDTTLRFSETRIAGVDGVIDLGDNNSFSQARISARRGSMELVLKPQSNAMSIHLSAKDWTLPMGPPLLLSKLEAKGNVSSSTLRFDTIMAILYGGELSGAAVLSWQKGLHLSGSFDAKQVNLDPLLTAIKPNAKLSGRLRSKGQFSGQGKDGASLGTGMRVVSDFQIDHGLFRGVDLVASVKGVFGGNAKPGDTPFDSFKGHLERDSTGIRLTDLAIESGLLTAKGNVFVAKDKTLDGDAKVALKNTASLIGTPELSISGTTDSPRVYPSKAAVAGGAVGTAILGPGLGTSLGIKAGELVKKIFSGGKNEPAKVEGPSRR